MDQDHEHNHDEKCDRDVISEDHHDGTVIDKNTDHYQQDDKISDEDGYDDVSLAEMLRANSELLNRMCRGSGTTVTLESTSICETGTDNLLPDPNDLLPNTDYRIPDSDDVLINLTDDIDSLAETSDSLRDLFADESSECSVNETSSRLWRSDDDESSMSAKPFAPFPSKVRQPKRLGIKLGLYPDDSNL